MRDVTNAIKMSAPEDQIGNTVFLGDDGRKYCVPADGIVWADREDVRDLVNLGFWPWRPSDDSSGGTGAGENYDPGDLTLDFDNALI